MNIEYLNLFSLWLRIHIQRHKNQNTLNYVQRRSVKTFLMSDDWWLSEALGLMVTNLRIQSFLIWVYELQTKRKYSCGTWYCPEKITNSPLSALMHHTWIRDAHQYITLSIISLNILLILANFVLSIIYYDT